MSSTIDFLKDRIRDLQSEQLPERWYGNAEVLFAMYQQNNNLIERVKATAIHAEVNGTCFLNLTALEAYQIGEALFRNRKRLDTEIEAQRSIDVAKEDRMNDDRSRLIDMNENLRLRVKELEDARNTNSTERLPNVPPTKRRTRRRKRNVSDIRRKQGRKNMGGRNSR